jgi:hypothetical protein
MDGYEWRMNRRRESEAYWVCAILNGAGRLKTAMRPERLLGRPIGAEFDEFAKKATASNTDKVPRGKKVA